MFKMSRRSFILLSTCACTAPAAFGQVPPHALTFGVIAPRAADQMKEAWRPFVERLGTSLRAPVDLRVYGESRDLVAAFKKGDIDFAWMGNAPALEVVEAGAGAVFAQMVTKDGNHGYNSVLVASWSSKLRTLNDVLQ